MFRNSPKLKICLLGDLGVGKTSIIKQFIDHVFSSQYRATIGSDFFVKTLDCDERRVTLQIWDTAGQERFRSLGPSLFRGTAICILVYDVTKSETFHNRNKWLKEFVDHLRIANKSEFPFLLFGNKSDCPDHAVKISKAQEFAQTNGGMLIYMKFQPRMEIIFKQLLKQ